MLVRISSPPLLWLPTSWQKQKIKIVKLLTRHCKRIMLLHVGYKARLERLFRIGVLQEPIPRGSLIQHIPIGSQWNDVPLSVQSLALASGLLQVGEGVHIGCDVPMLLLLLLVLVLMTTSKSQLPWLINAAFCPLLRIILLRCLPFVDHP